MEAYFTVAIAITAILLSLHIHYRIYPKKGTLTAPPPSPADLPSAPNRNKKEGRKSSSSNYRKERQTILVTGGCGLVGTSILQQLQKLEAYTLIGMDLFEPEADSPRKVEGVYYTAGNLCSQSVDEMGDFLNEHQVNGIIHTAGVVSMKDDPDTLISVNHYASTKLLLAAKHHTRCCSAFIVTSSASTVNPGTCDNIDISPCTEPADPFVHPDAFSTDYGRSKAAAELDVCHTNDPDIGMHIQDLHRYTHAAVAVLLKNKKNLSRYVRKLVCTLHNVRLFMYSSIPCKSW